MEMTYICIFKKKKKIFSMIMAASQCAGSQYQCMHTHPCMCSLDADGTGQRLSLKDQNTYKS